MKKIFLILFLLKFTFSISQNGNENYFPPTPEASTLMKYVDVPVNYSTGATNYSIPIHTIKLKNLNIPITLGYQSSGFKPSEIASNVGLGWEISAGGKIVQNIAGQSDIEKFGPNNNFGNLPNDRDFKLPAVKNNLNPRFLVYTQSQLDSLRGPGTDYNRFYDIDQYGTDTKPDLFYYSTPNKSGKFFFGDNFETKQIPFGKEKIIYQGGAGGFEIIDVDGTRYIYNLITQNYNWTENICLKFPKFNGNSNSLSYTFYLARIITVNNETVDFIYDTVKYSLANDKDYTRYYHSFFGGGEKVTTFYSEITTKVLTKIKVNQDYEIEFLYNNYRKDIKGTANATAPKTLDIIKIKNKNVIDTYNFNYGYFGIQDNEYNSSLFESLALNENSGYRLKLKSVQKIGETPYSFSYYNESPDGRYTISLDHWGYGSAGNGSRYTINTLFNDLGSPRQPDLEKTKANVLSKITLPTKGEVEFNYELNTCSDCDVSYTNYSWIPFVAYSNMDDNFSGEWTTNTIPFVVPKNITIPYVKFNLYSPGEATTTNYAIAELYDDQNHPMNFQLTGVPGDNFKPLDGVDLVVGKTYYLVLKSYDTMENENKYVMINFLTSEEVAQPITTVGGLRIKNIKTKDANNYITDRSFDYTDNGKSSGVLYEKPFYYDEYGYFDEGNGPDNSGLMIGPISYAVQYSRMPSDLFGFNGYHIFYRKVTEKNNDILDASNIIKTEKYFTFFDDIKYGDNTYFSKVSYNWKRGLPLQINEFNKTDIVRKTTFSYKFLDTAPGANTSKYDFGFPINNPTFPNEYYKRSIDLNVYRRSLSFYNLYLYTNSKLISSWYYMDKKTTEETLNGNVLKTEENYKYDNSVHAQMTSQTTTNSKGEILETKYYYPDDLLSEPFMLDLKNANRIAAPISTEQYKTGSLISKSKTVFAKDATTNNLILPKEMYSAKFPNLLPNISNVGNLEKKITYNQYDDKGNVLQFTQESGIPVSIIWGYNKTLPLAKIENVVYSAIPTGTISNLQSLSDADNDNCLSADCTEQLLRTALNTFRNSLPNAFITTYTYNPLVGVTSVTDPKGISSYYEYDVAGRLKFIKDQDLNVLQKYCYNYQGQQVNCGDNTSTSVVSYKSIARSGSFTRNNCASGGTGSTVSYSQPAGAVVSTISQTDADNNGLTKFNTDGQAYANANGACTFSSIARSGSFTKNNCASGGVGSSVSYSQAAGAQTSTVSQADADSKGLTLFNTNGQANANTNGTCTFSSIARSGSFTKNNCASGGLGSSVSYSQVAGAQTSTVSQADADSKGLALFNTNGQANANTNGTCTFYNVVKSGSFTRNNCASGGIGSTMTYTVAAGIYNSTTSQAAADALAQTDVNNNGQNYVNTNGTCTFSSIARSGSFTRNNCASGGVGSSVSYSQAAGAQTSTISQADADSKGLTLFNTNGQANANANGTCTFSSIARSGSFTRNNCAAGGVGSSVFYSQAAGAQTSTVSQADADSKGLTLFNSNGQANANTNGTCTFSSIARSGSFIKNNCAAGGVGSSVSFSQVSGAQTSTVSQADADSKGLALFNTNGQANANANGYCTFSSIARSGSFTRNNCAAGGTGSSVGYSLAAGAQTSTVSQADADSKGLALFNTNGQANANANGTCTFYSIAKSGWFTKNNCAAGGTGSGLTYSVAAGAYSSTTSQAAADALAQNDVNNNGQNYVNNNGFCTFFNTAKSGTFTKNNCAAGGTPSSVTYTVPAGAYSSTSSQAVADASAQTDVNNNGQNYANANGYCTFYNTAQSGTFTRNNCASGGVGSSVTYTVGAGSYSSSSSQAAADGLAQNAVNNSGQAYANANGTCTFRSQQIVYQIYKNDYCPPGTTYGYIYYIVYEGTYQSTISQADADGKAWADVSANAQAYANANARCLNSGETDE